MGNENNDTNGTVRATVTGRGLTWFYGYRGPDGSAGREQDANWGDTPRFDVRSRRGHPRQAAVNKIAKSRIATNPDMRSILKTFFANFGLSHRILAPLCSYNNPFFYPYFHLLFISLMNQAWDIEGTSMSL